MLYNGGKKGKWRFLNMRKIIVAACAGLGALALQAGMWRGLGDGCRYSGPRVTEEDLDGKVALVYCWSAEVPASHALLPRMEEIWRAFRTKPFVLLGSHRLGRSEGKVSELVKADKLTFPVYDDVGISDGEPPCGRRLPAMYVVDHRGRVVYSGQDDRAATEALVNALCEIGRPLSLVGDVQLDKYRMLEKNLVLGKNVKGIVKKLEGDVKRGGSRAATAVQKAQAAEASEILRAIASAKRDVIREIEAAKKTNPAKAVKVIKEFSATFPDDAVEYKKELPGLAARAKAAAAARKASAGNAEAKKREVRNASHGA